MTQPDLVENEDDKFIGLCEQCGYASNKRKNFVFREKTSTMVCKTCEQLDTTGVDNRPSGYSWGRWRVIILASAFALMFVSYGISSLMRSDQAVMDDNRTATINGIVQLTIMEDDHWEVSLHEYPTHTFWNPQNLQFRAGENVWLTVSPTSENFHRIDNWEYGRR